MACFITFEGIEGSGKTTQIKHLSAYLQAIGDTVVVTREPGGCAIADQIREVLLDPENSPLIPRAELFLYAAARAQHVSEIIQPALAAGKTVLCDRFSDATWAYQGAGRNLGHELISQLNALACNGVMPDLTLLLDLPVETGLNRALQREEIQQNNSEGRFERESLAFHQKVRDGYLFLASSEPERFRVINAEPTADVISQEIKLQLQKFREKT